MEDVDVQTAIQRSLLDSTASMTSEAMPAQSTDAPSSSTSVVPISPIVVEPVDDVVVGVEAQVIDDSIAAVMAKSVGENVTPGIETRSDCVDMGAGVVTRVSDEVAKGIDVLVDAVIVMGVEARGDDEVRGADTPVGDTSGTDALADAETGTEARTDVEMILGTDAPSATIADPPSPQA